MTRLVLILGMHRSGTSAIASALRSLGVDFGDRLLGPHESNPEGHFEDIDLLNTNERVLESVGSRWDRISPPDLARVPQGLVNTARFELKRKVDRYPIFGLKDPRMCRLLPFWKPIFAELGCGVSCVHVVRNPLSVADSLQRRNGIGPERALYLWLFHVVEAILDADRGWRKGGVVDYDRFVADTRNQIARVSVKIGADIRFFEGGPPLDSTDRRLRHHEHAAEEIATSPLCSPAITRAFTLLSYLAQDKPAPQRETPLRETFLAIRRELADKAHVFRTMDGAESRDAAKAGMVKGARAEFKWRGPGDPG